MHRCRLAALLWFALFTLPLWAVEETAEYERNARLLERWRADPEHYARLKRDLLAFWALPPERQEQLRQFDHDIHDCDSETQKHLWQTLELYANWFDTLPEAEQQRLLALNKQERLDTIKQLREEQWLECLPTKDRDYLNSLEGDKRAVEIANFQQQDRARRLAWQQALKLRPDLRPRPEKPTTLADFPKEVEKFVNEQLRPMLNPREDQQLKMAQGWPTLAQTILDLSDKHPVLPPLASGPIKQYDQLPQPVKNRLPKVKFEKSSQGKELLKHQNRWPEFALEFTVYAAKSDILLKPLGASKPADFSAAIQEFIKERLAPAITPVEAKELQLTEDKWPAYPKLLHELAKKYNLVIPNMSLPGSRELWESARTAELPEAPDHMLREFVGTLSQEEIRRLNLDPMDPSSRDRVRQEMFKRNPDDLRRMKDLDHKKKKQPGI